MDIKVLYQDEDILVIDKPPGLVVDPSNTQKDETLVDWLGKKYDRLVYHTKDAQFRRGVVHRLDKDTSGILLVGKTQQSFDNLQSQFKNRKIRKEYLALVHGWVEKGGVVDVAISRNPQKREKFMTVTQRRGVNVSHLEGVLAWHPREAVTEYEPVEKFQIPNDKLQIIFSDLTKPALRRLFTSHYSLFTFLVARPKTGRTHQIRVHLKYIGHPVVSDEKYVGRKMYRLDHRWCPRMFLHAAKLGFYHPVSLEWMEVESELPDDLLGVLGLLGK